MFDLSGFPGPQIQEKTATEGDMSDAQISANIISTTNRNEFINK